MIKVQIRLWGYLLQNKNISSNQINGIYFLIVVSFNQKLGKDQKNIGFDMNKERN